MKASTTLMVAKPGTPPVTTNTAHPGALPVRLILGLPDTSPLATAGESSAGCSDERWVTQVLATLGRLRAERVIDLDHVLCVAQSDCICALFDGTVRLPAAAVTLTINRSHTITVGVERVNRQSQGILVSYGSRDAGFIFSIKDNRLTYEYFCAGALYTVRSEREIPLDNLTLRFKFTKTGHLQGIGVLYVDDKQVGEGVIPHTLPYLNSSEDPHPRQKGRVGTPLLGRHGAAFSGKIREVIIRSTGGAESTSSISWQALARVI